MFESVVTTAVLFSVLAFTNAQFEIQNPRMSLLEGGGLRMAYPGRKYKY